MHEGIEIALHVAVDPFTDDTTAAQRPQRRGKLVLFGTLAEKTTFRQILRLFFQFFQFFQQLLGMGIR